MAVPQYSEDWLERYSRQLILPEVGATGQKKIDAAKVLVIGAGGLGSPCALYLAGAGVGVLGMVDSDAVDRSNLQRQVLHSTCDINEPKAVSAKETLERLNPGIEVRAHPLRVQADNLAELIAGYDIVVDGCDNFPTRFLVNDACVMAGKPLVSGALLRFEGQVTTILPGEGPCYRCLYPEPPPPGEVPSCQEAGVLGPVCGVVGSLQAGEVLKWILGKGELLVGRLLLFDGFCMQFRTLKLRRDPNCAVCGDSPTITTLTDYEQTCQLGRQCEVPSLGVDRDS